MNEFTINNWRLIKKHIRNVLIFFVSINIVAILSFSVVFNQHIKYIDKQLNNNIVEYGEIDREQLCKLSQCIKVDAIGLQKSYKLDKNNHLKRVKYNNKIFKNISGALYITDNYNLTVYNDISKTYFSINTHDILNDYIFVLGIFIPFSLLIFIYPLINAIKEEKKESIIMIAGNEALLANKSMINITENIHHELNTPLEVIDNKVEKIHRILSEYINKTKKSHPPRDIDKKIIKIDEDFQFIKTSSEQIYAVLEKMKSFKHLRYSNGNKSIKDIIDGGFKIINISNTNFEYNVDNKLEEFIMDGSSLKNAEFLSIILNHIKNSLEANATKIIILYTKTKDKKVFFRIIDNGNGIPKEIQAKVFRANFSTKNTNSGLRGNGMYLNKHIINDAGGNITLIASSNKGTTIEVSIPVKI